MNILILSGRFGMGHNAVSTAITEIIKKKYSSSNINTVDLLEELYPKLNKYLYNGFNLLVSKHHGLYNVLHKASSQIKVDIKPPGNVIYRKMKHLIQTYQPDLIISTLPLCAKTISDYKIKTGCKIKTLTCVTDISIHHEWITPKTDIYLVPTPEVKVHLIEKGIKKDRVFVTGIPIKSGFYPKKACSSKKNVLIMGGGLGLFHDTNAIIKELSKDSNINLTIITGKNKKAYQELKQKYKNAQVIGFTNNVNEFMQTADLIITKAGGITLFEAIYSETPLFVIHPFLDQEINNAKFIDKMGVGKVIWNKRQNVLNALQKFINNEEELVNVKRNMEIVKETVILDSIDSVVDILVLENAS